MRLADREFPEQGGEAFGHMLVSLVAGRETGREGPSDRRVYRAVRME